MKTVVALVQGLILVAIVLNINTLEALAVPVPAFGPLDKSYNLIIDDRIYDLRYGFNDTNSSVEKIVANTSSSSIEVTINTNSTNQNSKLFFIELPRNVINANSSQIGLGCSSTGEGTDWVQNHDTRYQVFVKSSSNGNTNVSEDVSGLCGRDSRTLAIEYPSGKSIIIIQGTSMVPEFPAPAIAAIAGVSVLIAYSKYRKSNIG